MNRFRIAGALTLGALLAGCADTKQISNFSGTIDGKQVKLQTDFHICTLTVGESRELHFSDYDCDGSLNTFGYRMQAFEDYNQISSTAVSTEKQAFVEAQKQYTAYLAKIEAERERLGLEALGVKR